MELFWIAYARRCLPPVAFCGVEHTPPIERLAGYLLSREGDEWKLLGYYIDFTSHLC